MDEFEDANILANNECLTEENNESYHLSSGHLISSCTSKTSSLTTSQQYTAEAPKRQPVTQTVMKTESQNKACLEEHSQRLAKGNKVDEEKELYENYSEILPEPPGQNSDQQLIGTIRYFDSNKRKYGPRHYLVYKKFNYNHPLQNHAPQTNPSPPFSSVDEINTRNGVRINLVKGGTFVYYPKFITESKRREIADTMTECSMYRQYSFGPHGYLEPRVHVLLSSKVTQDGVDTSLGHQDHVNSPGYKYHGVRMKAKPLSAEPKLQKLSDDIARHYKLPKWEWSIGVDLVVYRDGKDGINFHADDTQGETLILSVVAEAESGTARPFVIRPKVIKGQRQHGDERIELFISQGDAYEMDGKWQLLTCLYHCNNLLQVEYNCA